MATQSPKRKYGSDPAVDTNKAKSPVPRSAPNVYSVDEHENGTPGSEGRLFNPRQPPERVLSAPAGSAGDPGWGSTQYTDGSPGQPKYKSSEAVNSRSQGQPKHGSSEAVNSRSQGQPKYGSSEAVSSPTSDKPIKSQTRRTSVEKDQEVVRNGDYGMTPGMIEPDEVTDTCWTLKLFTVFYSVLILMASCLQHYFASVIDAISERYMFSDIQVDFVIGVSKIGFVMTVIFACLYGNTRNKPRIMAVGGIIFALGCLLNGIPSWSYGALDLVSRQTYLQAGMCLSNTNLSLVQCNVQPETVTDITPFSIICFAQFVCGAGIGMFSIIGIPFIQENSEEHASPLYIGIVLSMTGFGQLLGVGIAFLAKGFPEDLQDSSPGKAWWLGFPIFTILTLAAAIPLFFFPKWYTKPAWIHRVHSRVLQKYKEKQKRKAKIAAKKRAKEGVDKSTKLNYYDPSEAVKDIERKLKGEQNRQKKAKLENELKKQKMRQKNLSKNVKAYAHDSVRDLPRRVWRLVTNVPFTVSTLGGLLAAYYLGAYTTGVTDYVSIHYQRAAEPVILTNGLGVGLASAIGILVGGIVTSHFQLSMQRSAKVIMIVLAIGAVTSLIQMAFECPKTTTAGINSANFMETCNKDCDCGGVQLMEICGADQVNYLSPCHAGCGVLDKSVSAMNEMYSSCSCVKANTGNNNAGATAGRCSNDCPMFYAYTIILFLSITAVCVGQVPFIVIISRCVLEKYRCLSLGFSIWLIYLLAYTPGAMVFNKIRDSTCLIWRPDCNQRDTCWSHDLNSYRLLNNGVAALVLFIALIIFVGVWIYIQRRMKVDYEDNETVIDDGKSIFPSNRDNPEEDNRGFTFGEDNDKREDTANRQVANGRPRGDGDVRL